MVRTLRTAYRGPRPELPGWLRRSQAQAAHPDIFYNYYNGPTVFGRGTPAQLYISPRPTPPLVGHT